ncbi:MAG: hypothetical protein ACT4QE_03860 [Anaerolineales bacterium]
MNAEIILARLRRFLLIIAAALCAGIVVELWLTEHTEGIQFVPFVLCGLGLAVVLLTLFRPQRVTLLSVRIVMVLVALGSLFGIYEHIDYNAAFYMEIHPNAASGDVLWGALSGANPLLAPGILVLTALLAIAATYQHPALNRSA